MKFCNQCGQGNEDEADFCIQCGSKLEAETTAPTPPQGVAAPPPAGGPPPAPGFTAPVQQPTGFPSPPGAYQIPPPGVPISRPRPNDGSAIASLVLGIASFFTCWLIFGVLAVVFGYIGKRNIEESGGTLGGESFAVAGIILGWI
ncbi:MAG: DUF4190 domain-containing protein, partial [Actinobacteria bacterium]|nr:DUF4190 domain-containing protein [Actinomycetota bacterium]